jgi:hypothetical protein
MLQAPLAFKYVIAVAMINFVNCYAPRLHLPVDVPITRDHIRFLNVSPLYRGHYSARLQIENYSFSFSESMLLVNHLADDGLVSYGIPMEPHESALAGMERASRMKYSMNTNDLYLVASNYLFKLGVDVAKMEKTRLLKVNKYPMFHSDRGWVSNPLLTVEWEDTNAVGYNPFRVMEVQVSAVSGDLLHITDGSYFKDKEQPFVNDMDKLASISDDEFLKYSTLERSNLLVQFAGLHCTNMYYPGVDEPLYFRTNASGHGPENTNTKQN